MGGRAKSFKYFSSQRRPVSKIGIYFVCALKTGAFHFIIKVAGDGGRTSDFARNFWVTQVREKITALKYYEFQYRSRV